jgi:RNA recognition motif-containing protein
MAEEEVAVPEVAVEEAKEVTEPKEEATEMKEETSDEASTPASGSEDDRKLFVGGLPQEAKDLDIKEYFGRFFILIIQASMVRSTTST